MEWLTTCFLGIEMLYLRPRKNRLSTWIVTFKLSSLYILPMDFLGVDIHMSLGIVDIYDSVRPPLESHEDMNHMSDDWS